MGIKNRLDLALVIFVASACIAVFTTGANSEAFHGIVSDSACASNAAQAGTCNPNRIHADVASGAKYVLTGEDGAFELDGPSDQLAAFAGHPALLIGRMEDGRILVSSISVPRVEAGVTTP
jgi:hypothetical protein